MRTALAKYHNERLTFTGRFERFGTKPTCTGEKTILLRDICDETGNRVCDHMWLEMTRGFESLEPGTAVSFAARVTGYIKGYRGQKPGDWHKPIQIDYTLSRPTKVRKLGY